MATVSYPKVPSNAWQTLRSRVAAAPSTRLNASTVAAMLSMAPRSATDNVVTPLRRLGLINEDGALTERGTKWRVDATYSQACQEILDEIYPSDLTSLVDSNGQPEKSQVNLWFQHQGFGESNARQMAATYVMIADKRLPEPGNAEPKKKPVKVTTKNKPKKTVAAATSEPLDDSSAETIELPQTAREPTRSGPNIHLDIQIHIPATASADQIDQIFASMAKHLYP